MERRPSVYGVAGEEDEGWLVDENGVGLGINKTPNTKGDKRTPGFAKNRARAGRASFCFLLRFGRRHHQLLCIGGWRWAISNQGEGQEVKDGPGLQADHGRITGLVELWP